MRETGVIMTGISVYAQNTQNEKIREMEEFARSTAFSYEHVMQVHGFYVDEPEKRITFDVIIGFETKDREKIVEEIRGKVKEKYPDYDVYVTLDYDISD